MTMFVATYSSASTLPRTALFSIGANGRCYHAIEGMASGGLGAPGGGMGRDCASYGAGAECCGCGAWRPPMMRSVLCPPPRWGQRVLISGTEPAAPLTDSLCIPRVFQFAIKASGSRESEAPPCPACLNHGAGQQGSQVEARAAMPASCPPSSFPSSRPCGMLQPCNT